MGMILQGFKHLAEPAWNRFHYPSFRGVSETSEPGIHHHDRDFRFRACAIQVGGCRLGQ